MGTLIQACDTLYYFGIEKVWKISIMPLMNIKISYNLRKIGRQQPVSAVQWG
jgi:hypothetical protein